MNKSKQNGSAQVTIIAVLAVIIIGLLGFMFWQNVLNKDGKASNVQPTKSTEVKSEDKTELEGSESPVVSLKASKAGIVKAMNNVDFKGLDAYMAPQIERYISHSDATPVTAVPKETVQEIADYFKTYASPASNWKFAEFAEITDEKFQKQSANNAYYANTYVGIGDTGSDDIFVAFRFNEQGKINYVLQGFVLGY